MRNRLPVGIAALTLLVGGLACAGNKSGSEGAVVATDSTQAKDTSAYKGTQRDTATTRDTAMTGADRSSGYDHADTNQTPAPNSTSQNPPTQAPTDSGASSGMVRADTNQAGSSDSAMVSPPSANQQGGWSSDTAGRKSDSSATNPK